jgi:hypothetical protein
LFASGTTWAGVPSGIAPLGPHEVLSRNGAFVLDVNPEAQRNTVYATADRTRPVWSFPGILKTDVRKILVADNGLVVVLIGAGDVNDTDLSRSEGVRLIGHDGTSRSHRIIEFNRDPSFSYGCGNNYVNWFEDVIDHGDHFVIRTTDRKEHSFGYTTAPRFGPWPRVVLAGLACGVLLFLVRLALRRPPTGSPVEATS